MTSRQKAAGEEVNSSEVGSKLADFSDESVHHGRRFGKKRGTLRKLEVDVQIFGMRGCAAGRCGERYLIGRDWLLNRQGRV